MLRILFFCSVFSSLVICQQDSVKQITDLPFDCKNVAFFVNAYNYFYKDPGDQAVIFEGGNDTSSAIYELQYNDADDTFINPVQISKSQLNRNPVAMFRYIPATEKKYRLVFWESYNGNDWDIVASADSGNGWSEPYPVINSEKDETNLAIDCNPIFELNKFIYGVNNSVCLYEFENQTTDTIFAGNDTVSYSAGKFVSGSGYIAAEMRINGLAPKIIYRKWSYQSNDWSNPIIFSPDETTINPIFMYNLGIIYFIYEVINDNKVHTKWISEYDVNNPQYALYLHEDTTIESSAFASFIYPMPVFKKKDFNSFWPYSYRYSRNDSTFIRVNTQFPNPTYNLTEDYFTKSEYTKPVPGFVGITDDYDIIVYTIWQDSSNGHLNLFGVKKLYFPSDVEEVPELSFTLSQNYPNPFNPITKIRYYIQNRGNVTLKVYDILGKEVTTLVNEEEPAGTYEVTFNGSNLASGVYIYRLTSGQFSETKKLLLLK